METDLGIKSSNCDNAIMGRTIPSYRIALGYFLTELDTGRWD